MLITRITIPNVDRLRLIAFTKTSIILNITKLEYIAAKNLTDETYLLLTQKETQTLILAWLLPCIFPIFVSRLFISLNVIETTKVFAQVRPEQLASNPCSHRSYMPAQNI